MSAEEKYPEHMKLQKVVDKSQAIGEFLDWLTGEQGYVIAEFDEKYDQYVPMHQPIQGWLSRYFDIDQNVIEQEKRAMLDEMRAAFEKTDKDAE